MTDTTFLEAPIASTRKDLVAKALRDAILSGQLPPGTALNESKLAEQLKVSRSPLREAIRQLAEEGLVRTVSYKGATVMEIDDRMVDELYSLRSVLEVFALSCILPLSDPKLVNPLEEIIHRMHAAVKTQDRRTLTTLTIAFHNKICELTDHQLLIRHWQTINNHVQRCISLTAEYRHDLEHIPQNHSVLLRAIREGTLEEAQAAMQRHVLNAGKALRGWLSIRHQHNKTTVTKSV